MDGRIAIALPASEGRDCAQFNECDAKEIPIQIKSSGLSWDHYERGMILTLSRSRNLTLPLVPISKKM